MHFEVVDENAKTAMLLFYDPDPSITSVTVPGTVDMNERSYVVTEIRANAFCHDGRDFSSITEINLPESITRIGDYTFAGTGLRSFLLPENIESLGDGVFADTKLESISLSESNANYAVVDNVLYSKDLKTLVYFPAGRSETVWEVPSHVQTIGNGAFARQDDHEDAPRDIILPEGLIEIKDKAFWCCKIENLELPSTLRTIGNEAFYGNYFTAVTIPESVKYMGNNVFGGVPKGHYLSGGSYSTKTTKSSYVGDLTLESSTPPSFDPSLFDIVYGMNQCNATVFVPKGSLAAYQADKNWSRFILYEDSKRFKTGDKDRSQYIVTDAAKNTVESLACWFYETGNGTIYYPSHPNETIPDTIENEGIVYHVAGIGERSYGGVSYSDHVFWPEYIPLNGVTDTLKIHSNLKYIRKYACAYNKLKRVKITEFVENIDLGVLATTIDEYAFYNCENLTEVDIPVSITAIDQTAFKGCSRLNTVYCYNPEPPTLTARTFDAGMTLHVPYGKKAVFENAEYWKDFPEIIDDINMPGDVNNDGRVSVTDVVTLTHRLRFISTNYLYPPTHDANGDGVIDDKDRTTIVDFIVTDKYRKPKE